MSQIFLTDLGKDFRGQIREILVHGVEWSQLVERVSKQSVHFCQTTLQYEDESFIAAPRRTRHHWGNDLNERLSLLFIKSLASGTRC